jgi:hypothetical protein
MNNDKLPLILISAMYENGGNTLHRHLDGHPELFVYPFESQLGTRLVNDHLTSLFPFKYRWPVFPMQGTAEEDFELFFDEEAKTRLRNPAGSKFRDADLQIQESDRKDIFVETIQNSKRTRGNLVTAFFKATFKSWKNYNKSGKEKAYVGYSPIVGVDGESILKDLPDGHVVHIVRNPYSAYAETKRRPFPMSLKSYVLTWSLLQHLALTYSSIFPHRFHIIRYEDLVSDTRNVLTGLIEKLGFEFDDSLLYASWNGKRLDQVYPWGTIRKPSVNTNKETMDTLSDTEKQQVKSYAHLMIKEFGYNLNG